MKLSKSIVNDVIDDRGEVYGHLEAQQFVEEVLKRHGYILIEWKE